MAPDLLLAFFNSSGFVFELLFSIALFTSQVRRRRYFCCKSPALCNCYGGCRHNVGYCSPRCFMGSSGQVPCFLSLLLCRYPDMPVFGSQENLALSGRRCHRPASGLLRSPAAGFLYRARCRGQTVTGPIFQCYLCSSIDSVFYLCIFSVCAQDTEDAF